jgi:hypothetical protein
MPIDRRGFAGLGGGARVADITDGTSNTIALWEIQAGASGNDPRGVWALGRGVAVGGCDLASGTDCWGLNSGWTTKGGAPDDVHECVATPAQGLNCWPNGDGQHGPKSLHTGGVHALLSDGAVKFVNDSLNVRTHQALNSISAGETISNF